MLVALVVVVAAVVVGCFVSPLDNGTSSCVKGASTSGVLGTVVVESECIIAGGGPGNAGGGPGNAGGGPGNVVGGTVDDAGGGESIDAMFRTEILY